MSITNKIVRGSTRIARARRHFRVRKRITGTAERPRLVVTRSARHLVAQVVDDSKGYTLASASTMEKDLRAQSSDKTRKLALWANLSQIVRKQKESPKSYSTAVVIDIPDALRLLQKVLARMDWTSNDN